nr:MAG TPA: hypothetical protein [Caudoviricetes sp.]
MDCLSAVGAAQCGAIRHAERVRCTGNGCTYTM